jgi:hypothetical protein
VTFPELPSYKFHTDELFVTMFTPLQYLAPASPELLLHDIETVVTEYNSDTETHHSLCFTNVLVSSR